VNRHRSSIPMSLADRGSVPQLLAPLLTVPEVARLLRVHPRTVRRLVADRRLPCVRVGTRVRFDQRSVLRWLGGRED